MHSSIQTSQTQARKSPKAKWLLWFGSSWYCKAKGVDPYPGEAVQPIVLSTERSQTDYQMLAQRTHQPFFLQAKEKGWSMKLVLFQ